MCEGDLKQNLIEVQIKIVGKIIFSQLTFGHYILYFVKFVGFFNIDSTLNERCITAAYLM